MNGRGLIIGAARSGAGKTSVTIGLLRAFKRRGLAINGAKSGPDYIDPGFHSAASGQRGVNLDSWAMAPDLLAGLLAHAASGQDLLLIESAMGLFDGIDGGSGRSGVAIAPLPGRVLADAAGRLPILPGALVCRPLLYWTSLGNRKQLLLSPMVLPASIQGLQSPA